MSLLGQISKNPNEEIPKLLDEYDVFIEQNAGLFETDGVKLEDLCRQHSKNLDTFDRRLQSLKTVEEYVRGEMKIVESKHWRKFNEQHNRSLNTSDIKAYIAGEPDFVLWHTVLLEVIHLRQQYESVVETLKSMNWQLSNIVKLRVAAIEDAVL